MAKWLKTPWVAIALSIVAGFLVGGLVLAASGFNPFAAYAELLRGVFGKPRYMVETVIAATPVIITGVAVAFAFKTGLFNIGAEGQFMVGAIAASFLGYALHLPAGVHPAAVLIGAALIGALYGGFVGFLKARFGIHEVLASIMLNWIALHLNNWYTTIPFMHKPNTNGVYEIQPTAHINVWYQWKKSAEGAKWLADKVSSDPGAVFYEILQRTNINYGILIAIGVALAAWLVLNRTTLGYELKAVGQNAHAAEFAGINVKRAVFTSMAISGAIAGMAGAVYITSMGSFRISTLSMSEQYGFNGLSVALIGNTSPIGCVFGGLLFGALNYGSGGLQSNLNIPKEIINIMIGTIVFFIGIKTIFGEIARRAKRKGGGKS